MIGVSLAMAMLSVTGSAKPTIIFSAKRFEQHLDKVYSLGPAHLYSMGVDGRGVRQITTGPGFDVCPEMSLDGKRVLFWRCKGEIYQWTESAKVELCSIDPDGSNLRDLHRVMLGYPRLGLARAFEHYGPDVLRSSGNDNAVVVHDLRNRWTLTVMQPLFSADCKHLIGYHYDDGHKYSLDTNAILIDLESGRVTVLGPKYWVPLWIDNRSIFATVGNLTARDAPSIFVVLDTRGRETVRRDYSRKEHEAPESNRPFDDDFGIPRRRRSFSIGKPGLIVVQSHFSMSDGGYDSSFEIDMRNGTFKELPLGALEGVSGDGSRILGSDTAWVGGYKGMGAWKLCKMFLWDTRKETSTQVGFRHSLLFGACFVPEGR